MTTLATDAGRTDIPLLDHTIGVNLARTHSLGRMS